MSNQTFDGKIRFARKVLRNLDDVEAGKSYVDVKIVIAQALKLLIEDYVDTLEYVKETNKVTEFAEENEHVD